MQALAMRLAQGLLPLVDCGRYASNIVHVDNLVEAILCAIRADRGAGERYFVNETQPVPWKQVFEDLAQLLSLPVEFIEVGRDQVVPLLRDTSPPLGIRGHFKVALSGEFRSALSKMPIFAAMNSGAGALFAKLPRAQQLRIRERLQWPIKVPRRKTGPPLDDRYVTVQARRFHHSTEKLQRTLSWRPVLDYRAGLESTSQWLKFANIVPSGR
jgi:nucleoside-diphosphate-sugar epimerase